MGRPKTGIISSCKICGKPVYRTKTYIAKNRGLYCSMECRDYGKSITKICIGCGKSFSIPQSNANRYMYCTLECKRKHIIYVTCKKCGKIFRISKESKKRIYCSRKCRFGDPQYATCLTCRKKFPTKGAGTYHLKKMGNQHRFCSVSCYRKYKGETTIEAKIRKCLETLNIGFTQEAQIGRYSVDFYIHKTKLCIEVDGTYWHKDKERDIKKELYLANNGFTIERFSEHEINTSDNLLNHVQNRINLH